MTRANYAAQRRKLEKEIQRLQKQAAALEKKERMPVIREIVRSMREYGITPEEIEEAFNRRTRSAAKRAAKPASGTVRAPVPQNTATPKRALPGPAAERHHAGLPKPKPQARAATAF